MVRRRFRGDFVRDIILPLIFVPLLISLASCATEPTRNPPLKGVAVWEFEDLSPLGSGIDVGGLLSDRVTDVLKSRGEYTVVERSRLVRVLEELRLGSSALADEETRLRVGRLAGARYMVFGGYQVIGAKMRLDVRLVEVESGRVIKAVQKTAPGSDISVWLEAAGNAAAEL